MKNIGNKSERSASRAAMSVQLYWIMFMSSILFQSLASILSTFPQIKSSLNVFLIMLLWVCLMFCSLPCSSGFSLNSSQLLHQCDRSQLSVCSSDRGLRSTWCHRPIIDAVQFTVIESVSGTFLNQSFCHVEAKDCHFQNSAVFTQNFFKEKNQKGKWKEAQDTRTEIKESGLNEVKEKWKKKLNGNKSNARRKRQEIGLKNKFSNNKI